MHTKNSTQEAEQQFTCYAKKMLDSNWSTKDVQSYLTIAILAWNTSILKKPDRIKEIESFISKEKCPAIQLGAESYDTLELTVGLAHLKKALFPNTSLRIRSAEYVSSSGTFRVSCFSYK